MFAVLALAAIQASSGKGMMVKLPSGQALHLIAVGSGPATWSPDGGPAPQREYLGDSGWDFGGIAFVVEYERPPTKDYARIAMQLLPDGAIMPCGTNTIDVWGKRSFSGPDRWYAIASMAHRPERKTADLRVGYAYGAWRTVESYRIKGPNIIRVKGESKVTGLAESKAPKSKAADVHFLVETPKKLDKVAVRILALDRRGTVLASHGSITKGSAVDYYFEGPKSRLATIEIQTQPYTWAVFKNVSLRPSTRGE